MRLRYQGGDGNDIVISAEQTEPGIGQLLPAVQKVRAAADETTQAREYILLARQVGVLPVDESTSSIEARIERLPRYQAIPRRLTPCFSRLTRSEAVLIPAAPTLPGRGRFVLGPVAFHSQPRSRRQDFR